MVFNIQLLMCCLFLASGCAHVQNKASGPMPRSMKEIYMQTTHEGKTDRGDVLIRNLKEEKIFGYVKPYVPVIGPPIVKKVWIPNHKSEHDAGVLISGHWVYIMVKGPTWFIDEEVQDHMQINVLPHNGKIQKNAKSTR